MKSVDTDARWHTRLGADWRLVPVIRDGDSLIHGGRGTLVLAF